MILTSRYGSNEIKLNFSVDRVFFPFLLISRIVQRDDDKNRAFPTADWADYVDDGEELIGKLSPWNVGRLIRHAILFCLFVAV